MGFEGPRARPEPERQSVDEILAALNAGEIIQGEKDGRTIKLTNGIEARFYANEQLLTFEYGGVIANVTIVENTINKVTLTDPLSGDPKPDEKIEQARWNYIQTLLDKKQIQLYS